MKNYNELTETLRNCYTNKLALVYQWVKSDTITFEQFQDLIQWIKDYEEAQVRWDTFD